jgi:predicted DNA binding protein
VDFRIRQVDYCSPTEIGSKLSKMERQIVRVAYDMGYFEFPKQVHLKDIAEKTSLSIPTIDEYIWSSQRKIFSFSMENFTM